MRLLAPLALLVAAFIAAPASAQIDKGCYNYSGQNVWTAKSVEKLRADIECFKGAKGKADISIANREKRIAQLAPVGDQKEPELGVNLDKEPAPIPSNFNVASLLAPSWGTGAIAVTGKPDTVGAFRFDCGPGQILRDDPIVFPGQPGKSHLHQFFGNTLANAYSDYQSLRTTGDSTCINKLNRSAYWMPAMLDGKGNVVLMKRANVYYKRFPEGSVECTTVGKACKPLPRGLRFIFGYDMVNGSPPTGSGTYGCTGPTAIPGAYRTIPEAAKGCGPGNDLFATISSPGCWDGKHLDSPDHRSHLSFAGYGSIGKLHCDDAHPYVIPSVALNISWHIEEGDDLTLWTLSSDDMTAMGHGKMPGGSTLHVDFFGAQDETIVDTWTANCINKLLSCNGGDLGNGTQMRSDAGPAQPRQRLVPIPAL